MAPNSMNDNIALDTTSGGFKIVLGTYPLNWKDFKMRNLEL